jgi:Transposase DDE domain
LGAARKAGIVSAKRVLDSTPLYDAVATQDTVTMIRSAIRRLLAVVDAVLNAALRAVLKRGDEYVTAGKPVCDWDDKAAREQLVNDLANDAYACLGVLDGRQLTVEVTEAGELLATVVGQDLETGEDGRFRIARKVAKGRVISTVDPDARHGHKTSARGFDGYKGHAATDPDSEIITDTKVTAGNASDGSVAADLIDDLLNNNDDTASDDTASDDTASDDGEWIEVFVPDAASDDSDDPTVDDDPTSDDATGDDPTGDEATVDDDRSTVYGDAAYGSGEFQKRLEDANIVSGCRTQSPTAAGGKFARDRFTINLADDTVSCPNNVTVTIRRGADGYGIAYFAAHCAACPLRGQCTNAAGGRTIGVSRYEAVLARARTRQQDPAWRADYRATRPKVERKLGHMMRRRHGGRRARVRGTQKVDADFNLLAAAVNLARFAVLGLHSTPNGWAVTT